MWLASKIRVLTAGLLSPSNPYRHTPAPVEITPEFFEEVIVALRSRGFEIVSLDAALARLAEPARGRAPFAVLSFDDGVPAR